MTICGILPFFRNKIEKDSFINTYLDLKNSLSNFYFTKNELGKSEKLSLELLPASGKSLAVTVLSSLLCRVYNDFSAIYESIEDLRLFLYHVSQ